ncbi:MAG TPA: sulfite exporter TauE/SafE family protein, partial [Gammaproteobacteria bacterium]|nr:sulfite exporter TauE/SafE family protein [Gammaproteobacteria bacterium]
MLTELATVLPYFVVGAAAGFFAGLLGIGGGGVMVPVLTALFVSRGLPFEYTVHLALGTSMAVIVLTSVSSLLVHHRHSAVLWPVVHAITPGILFGTFGAAFVSAYMSFQFLAIFFSCFMGVIAIVMLLNVKPRPSRQLPGVVGLSVTGVAIG